MKKLNFINAFNNLIEDIKDVKKNQLSLLTLLQSNNSNSESNNSQLEEWITVKETCKILGCSEVTLWKFRKENTIPYSRLKRTIRYKKVDVLNYLNQK
jgi:excisionase family DNA binding protein